MSKVPTIYADLFKRLTVEGFTHSEAGNIIEAILQDEVPAVS